MNAYLYISALILLYLSEILSHNENPLILLISFDGFRYDYLDKVAESGRKTPNFDFLRNEGVEAKHVKNQFVTKTFPNHYSIATGYHEASHGVTHNHFYDSVLKMEFGYSDDTNSLMFNNGTESGGPEPIWVTNERAEHSELFKKRSGVMMWPGGGAEIHGVLSTYHVTYNKEIDNKARIDQVVDWFSREDKPINLGLLYISEPDNAGHTYGPDSDEVLDLIVELDHDLEYLLDKLKAHKLMHRMNLIVTSDHGMMATPEENLILLNKHIEPDLYDMYGSSPVLNIQPKEGKMDEVYDKLSKIPHLNTYKKEDIPADYFYSWNNRIQPIVVVSDPGYNVVQNGSSPKGQHGFNNSLEEMHPFFIAHGPSFKQNFTAKPFNNIDIYPLMCHLLDINPYPNNGSLENIMHILESEEEESFLIFNMTILTFLLSVGFAALVSGIFCISAFRSYRILLRRKKPLVVRLNNVHDGHTHLLSNDEEDEEEIP